MVLHCRPDLNKKDKHLLEHVINQVVASPEQAQVAFVDKRCILDKFVFPHVKWVRRCQFLNKTLHLSHLVQLVIEGLDDKIRYLVQLLDCVICVLFLLCVLKVEARGTK